MCEKAPQVCWGFKFKEQLKCALVKKGAMKENVKYYICNARKDIIRKDNYMNKVIQKNL